MLKAVLFDLDGTLLNIELDSFLAAYFSSLGPLIAAIVGGGITQDQALDAVVASTHAMSTDHPGLTNRTVFNRRFLEMTGGDLDEPATTERIEHFYAEQFPGLQGPHGPRPGGVDAVCAAREAGFAVVLATNPIFPLSAIRERMRWAELDGSWFTLVTSYETSFACKPSLAYYRRIAQVLGVKPSECLMVGDDAVLDLAAADIGMKTFFVGNGRPASADLHGDLGDVRSFLLSVAPKG
jgi:FMN phosphatase YigB (HAD superfamily)